MRSSNALCIATAALTLAACASPAPQLVEPPARIAPPTLTAPCPPLPEMANETMGELLRIYVETAQLYHQCAERHRALGEWVGGE